jgi:hypothetical protein
VPVALGVATLFFALLLCLALLGKLSVIVLAVYGVLSLVAFLASDVAGNITGADVTIDGGLIPTT